MKQEGKIWKLRRIRFFFLCKSQILMHTEFFKKTNKMKEIVNNSCIHWKMGNILCLKWKKIKLKNINHTKESKTSITKELVCTTIKKRLIYETENKEWHLLQDFLISNKRRQDSYFKRKLKEYIFPLNLLFTVCCELNNTL